MLYSTQAKSKQAGPRAVWPWFFLSLLSLLIIGMSFLATWPGDYPSKDKLVKAGGHLQTTRIRDDITNSGEGSMLPVLTSVYMRFRDDEREYRYPWTHAKYYYVRDYTFYNVEIWVNKEDLERNDGKPVMIWALEERNPHEGPEDQTSVTYQENIKQFEKSASSLMKLAKWLGSAAVIFLIVGGWTMHWNRRNYPAFKASSLL